MMAPSALLSLPEELQAKVADHLFPATALPAADQHRAVVSAARALFSLRISSKQAASFGRAAGRPLLLELALLTPRITRWQEEIAACVALVQLWREGQASRIEVGDFTASRDSLACKRAAGSVQTTTRALLRLMARIAARAPKTARSQPFWVAQVDSLNTFLSSWPSLAGGIRDLEGRLAARRARDASN